MLLSGGTTSLSKLIPRTHNDYVLNARLCGAAAGFDLDTVFMAILPLGHNYNLASPGMLGTFFYGGTVVIAPSGDAEEVFGLVARERVSVIAAVVPLISNWLSSAAPGRFDLSSLKVIQNGGARLAPELRSRLRARFGCIPQEIYGTAEGLINMTRLDDPDELLLQSSGAPVCADDEIAVVDEDGNEVADGASGELITRGPYTIRGYYNAPETNAAAFTSDGFYRMGDIVRKLGRHVFTEGRKKDLINRGGEKDQLRRGGESDLRASQGKGRDPGGDARSDIRREGVRLRHSARRRDSDIRRVDRVSEAAEHRELQVTRAIGTRCRISFESGRQDPQAAVARGDRRETDRRERNRSGRALRLGVPSA